MGFYSTWADVRALGIDDTAFIKSFIERSTISISELINGCDEEIKIAVQILNSLSEKDIISIICKEEPISLKPADVPCFSTFSNGAQRLNELLEFAIDGLTYAEIGFQLVGASTQYAQIKYGENHAKLAEMMSLVKICDHKPAIVLPTSLGHYFVTLTYKEKETVLKKLLMRNTCVQAIIQAASCNEANYRKVVENLSDSTAYRRRTSVKCVVEFALNLPESKQLLDKIVWDLKVI